MMPSPEQVEVAAYHRWLRRGGVHGQDWNDWFAAEQDLLFALNYELLARHRLDGVAPHALGDADAPRCRFCEQAAPHARFSGPAPALPAFLGNTALLSWEECDECREHARTLDAELEHFARPFLDGSGPGDGAGARPYVPIAAYKALVRAALAFLPADELHSVEDTIEWVGNPDHRLDGGLFRDLACAVVLGPEPAPVSWAAVARRVDDDAPLPYLLGFVATGRATFQVHLPLCLRDEDHEGPPIVPRTASPFGVGRGPDWATLTVVPMGSPQPRRDTWLASVPI